MLTWNLTSLPVLETQRLVLREHNLTDAVMLYGLRTNEELMRYIDRPRPKSVEEAETVIQSMLDKFKTGQNLVWAIVRKDQPAEMIGNAGYWRTDLANHRAEAGYALHPEHWRKGIIYEAMTAIIDFGFKQVKFHSVCANINPANNASRQLLLKLGFIKEAYFRQDYYFDGQFLDSEIYGLLNPDH